jgi:hypothetical protein
MLLNRSRLFVSATLDVEFKIRPEIDLKEATDRRGYLASDGFHRDFVIRVEVDPSIRSKTGQILLREG